MRIRWKWLLRPFMKWALVGCGFILLISILWLIFKWPTGTEQPNFTEGYAEIVPLRGEERNLKLHVWTAEEYGQPCEIVGQLKRSRRTLTLSLGWIGLCSVHQMVAHASNSWVLEGLNGQYTLRFKTGWFRGDSYDLYVDEERVALTPRKAPRWVKIEPVDFRWVPRDTVWAKIFVRRGDKEAITGAVLADLTELGAAEARLPAGDYYWFAVDEQGHASTDDTPVYIFTYKGEIEPLQELVQQYHQEYGNQVYIELYAASGD